MHIFPLVILLGWIPFGAFLFRRYPVRIAILANFLGGWAILPGANYQTTADAFPYWILGVCLPTDHSLTKATATGLAALAGILFVHFSDLKKFRPSICDLPMAVWCCVPLLSATAHWNTLHEALIGAIYQTVSWGVPWLLGRIYFSDDASLLLAAKACVIAGICYVPICLFEICAGPQLYAFFYGYQPYRLVGAARYIGFRPIGFLEDGNQLGIWMAGATLLAVFLALHRLSGRIMGLPIAWASTGLAGVTLLCQSAGSILLLALLLPLALLKRRFFPRVFVAALVVSILAFALFRMTNLVSLRALAQREGVAHSLSTALTEMGRHSLAWRFARDESHITVALRRPFLGSGQWNWWQNGDSRPWALWLLVFGMYGLVGLVAFGTILLLPVERAVWPPAGASPRNEPNLRLAMAALILMVAIDNLLNGAMILPYLLIMGGLAAGSRNCTEALAAKIETDTNVASISH
ncbi:MAG: hypothetical protein ABSC76_00420 [Terracidiphilus sp.]|jgi:hypothetical protein